MGPIKPIRDIYRQFIPLAKEAKLKFSFELKQEDDLWAQRHLIRIDALRFGQVLRNLLTNAFKFTPAHGSVSLRLSCIFSDRGAAAKIKRPESSFFPFGWLLGQNQKFIEASTGQTVSRSEQAGRQMCFRVEVIDSGAGISKENQKKLFGQYVQFNANSLQKGGGSGLGLWISKGKQESTLIYENAITSDK